MARRRRLPSTEVAQTPQQSNEEHDAEVEIRQVKYLNNVVEQDHRAIKRQVRPMLGLSPSGRLPRPWPVLSSCI